MATAIKCCPNCGHKLTAPAKRTAATGAMSGAAWQAMLAAAQREAREWLGSRWWLDSACTYATIPRPWRTYKTDRGTVIRNRADQRLPPAEYWPGGVYPVGLELDTTFRPATGEVVCQHTEHSTAGERYAVWLDRWHSAGCPRGSHPHPHAAAHAAYLAGLDTRPCAEKARRTFRYAEAA